MNGLRREFNKKFDEVYQLKGNLMESIAKTNDNLRNIFKNMNCMLCLLNMERYNPAPLTVANWEKNEVITRIMDVGVFFLVVDAIISNLK